MFGLFAVGFLVYAAILAHAAYGERAQAGRFRAAPRCVANAAPAGDCAAWQMRTVSRVNPSRSGLDIDLDGGALHLWYAYAPGWVHELMVGESVPVLVWEGSAQALRDPQGHVFYSDDSALHQRYGDIGRAVQMSGFALVATVCVFAFSRGSSGVAPATCCLPSCSPVRASRVS